MMATARFFPSQFPFQALVCTLITLACNPTPFGDRQGGSGGGDNHSSSGGGFSSTNGGGNDSSKGGGDSSGNGGGDTSNGGGTASSNGGGTSTGKGGGTASSGGGSGGGGSGGGAAGIPLDLYCSTRAPIVCDSFFIRCGQMFPEERANCLTIIRTNCERQRVAQVGAKTTSYDPIKAAECLNQMPTRNCNDLYFGGSQCSNAFQTGLGKLGTACGMDAECQRDAGLVCLMNESCSTCGVPPSLGQKCGVGPKLIANCVGESYCALSADGGTRVCAPKLAPGEECLPLLNDCQAGSRCDYNPDSGTQFRCQKLLADDAGCVTNTQCLSGICNDGLPQVSSWRCGTAPLGSTCREHVDCGAGRYCQGLTRNPDGGLTRGSCAVKTADGASCVNNEISSDSCANASATCLDGKCVVTPPSSRTLGQSCDAPTQCANGTTCAIEAPLTHEGKCTATVAPGARCNPGICPFGYACTHEQNEDAGTCTTRLVKGPQVCQSSAVRCSTLAVCNYQTDGGGTCRDYGNIGESCLGTGCINSFCKQDAGTCAPYQPLGAFCETGSQCQSGVCRKDASGGNCVAACL